MSGISKLMLKIMTKVLIIAPHMDDEILGCGATIAKHVDQGDEVYVCVVAHRIYNHVFDKEKNDIEINHSQMAKELLGYKEIIYLDLNDERLDVCLQDIIIPLEGCVSKIKPEIVYIPFYEDNNQDHRAVFEASQVVLRPLATDFIKQIFMYETSSSTDQSPPILKNSFLPNYYINVENYLDKKIRAARCYETENRNYPHPRSERALIVLAEKRGIEIGFRAAEAFVILRNKWE